MHQVGLPNRKWRTACTPRVLRTRSGFRISERDRLDRAERASPVYAVVVSFAPESGLLSLCDQTAGVDPKRPLGINSVDFELCPF